MPDGNDDYFRPRHFIEYQVGKWPDYVSPKAFHVGSLPGKWLIGQKIKACPDTKLDVFCTRTGMIGDIAEDGSEFACGFGG